MAGRAWYASGVWPVDITEYLREQKVDLRQGRSAFCRKLVFFTVKLFDRTTYNDSRVEHLEVKTMCSYEDETPLGIELDDNPVDEDCFPYNVTDFSDDADVLASAGMGTDEDYGHYGGDEW